MTRRNPISAANEHMLDKDQATEPKSSAAPPPGMHLPAVSRSGRLLVFALLPLLAEAQFRARSPHEPQQPASVAGNQPEEKVLEKKEKTCTTEAKSNKICNTPMECDPSYADGCMFYEGGTYFGGKCTEECYYYTQWGYGYVDTGSPAKAAMGYEYTCKARQKKCVETNWTDCCATACDDSAKDHDAKATWKVKAPDSAPGKCRDGNGYKSYCDNQSNGMFSSLGGICAQQEGWLGLTYNPYYLYADGTTCDPLWGSCTLQCVCYGRDHPRYFEG